MQILWMNYVAKSRGNKKNQYKQRHMKKFGICKKTNPQNRLKVVTCYLLKEKYSKLIKSGT